MLKLLRKPVTHSARMQCGPIGIDFALAAIHAVQFCTEDEKIQLHAAASAPYPDSREATLNNPGVLKSLLRQLIKSGTFSGNNVVAALPPTKVKILPIQYPTTHERNEAKEILDLIKDRLDQPLNDYVIDYIPVRQDTRDGQSLALVTVAEHNMVMRLLETLSRARLTPVALEIGPTAIRRLIANAQKRNKPENLLVVNIGETSTYLTIISGRRLLMDQSIEIGQRDLLKAIASALETDSKEALRIVTRCGLSVEDSADLELRDRIQTLGLILTPGFHKITDEIGQAFRYASSICRDATAEKIYLTGSVSHWPGAEQFLSQICGMQVERLSDILDEFVVNTAHVSDMREQLIASGLALRGVQPDV